MSGETSQSVDLTAIDAHPLREMLKIAFPAVLTMTSVTAMQFVDKLFVTKLGPDALAAAGNGGVAAFFLMATVMGVLGIINTYVSQNLGAGRRMRGTRSGLCDRVGAGNPALRSGNDRAQIAPCRQLPYSMRTKTAVHRIEDGFCLEYFEICEDRVLPKLRPQAYCRPVDDWRSDSCVCSWSLIWRRPLENHNMNLVLDRLPEKKYRFTLHLDTEAHCFDRLPEDIVRINGPSDLDQFDELPRGAAVVMQPYDTELGFNDYISKYRPALEAFGVHPDEVLVVSDCWGKGGDCRNMRIHEHDWTPLMQGPFDVALWSGEVCPIAHELVAAYNR